MQRECAAAAVADAIEKSGGRALRIRCSALSPGIVCTAMQAAIGVSGIKRTSGVPRDRLPGPVAPAEVAAWPLSGEADALAGTMVSIHDHAGKQGMGRVG